jgi:hypothetical protein
MKTSTAYNHSTRLIGWVQHIYMTARSCGSTHQHILGQLAEKVYGDPAWKKMPQWARQSVTDLGSTMLKELYRPVLYEHELRRMLAEGPSAMEKVAFVRWQLRVDGEFVTTEDICARRKAGDDDVWNRVEGAYIWNHMPDRVFDGWKNFRE